MSNTPTDGYIFIFLLLFLLVYFVFVFAVACFFLFIVPFVFFACLFFVVVFVCFVFFFSLGLNDRNVEGEFLWSDRSAVEYINWDKFNSYYSWRDCASVKKDNEGRWRDQSCYNSFSYICKKPKGL